MTVTRLLGLALLAAGLAAADYHVAPDGDDAAAGTTPDLALRTISRAAELARPGDRVVIATGIYRETVRPAVSGEPGRPIVFTAAEGARVVVSGTEPIEGWEPAGERRFRAPMPADFFVSAINQADQVFVDGEMVPEARWPDLGGDLSRPAKATIDRYEGKDRDGHFRLARFSDAALERFDGVDLSGAGVHLQPNAEDDGWGWTLSGVVERSTGGQLVLRTPNAGGKDGGQGEYAVGARYHLFGHPALLDAPGEWIHDREAGRLVLRPPRGGRPRSVEAKARDWGFDLSERSHIEVRGLRFFACTLTTDARAGGDGVGYGPDGAPRYPWRPRGYVAPSSHVVVADCHFRYVNHFTDVSGHFFLQWGQHSGVVLAGEDHLIERCVIEYAAGNGIQLQGRRHRAIGNVIRDTDYAAVDCAAIQTGIQTLAEDFEIAWNTIERTGRSGMVLRGLRNSDPANQVTRIHHNLVRDWLLQDSDGGAFYTFGQDGAYTRIDHNRFEARPETYGSRRGGMFYGAYWDFSKRYVLDHNIITGCAVPIQVTREFDPDGEKRNDLLIVHNTTLGNDAAWSRPISQGIGRGSLVRYNVFKVATFRKPDGNPENHWPGYGSEAEADANAVYGDQPGAHWTKERAFDPDDHHIADPELARDGSFEPTAGSPLVDAAEVLGAIERQGVRVVIDQEPVVGDAPDIGAVERGAPVWDYGAPAEVAERRW